MLVEESHVRAKIRRTVRGLACPAYLLEDLEQEGIIHLWLMERECPRKTLSWYCEACCFHVRDQAKRGRSLDSPRRWHLGVPVAGPGGDGDGEAEKFEAKTGTPLEHCCAQDLLEQLTARLDEIAREVLDLRLHGYGVREIGERVRLSPGSVVRYCDRIASTAERLGLVP